MLKRFNLLVTTVLILFTAQAWAAVDVYEFSSEQNRELYHKLTEELRCPKCKNNNLAGTNSQIAVDLRRELHRMVEEGQSEEQITEFMVSRYGDFVLYRPRLQKSTLALWLVPITFVGIGGIAIGAIVSRRRRMGRQGKELSDNEKEALEQMLKGSAKR